MRKKLCSALQNFIQLEQFSGLLLIGCLAVALLIAHSGFAASYERFLHDYSLQHWINEGLMAVFFFVVGLEIKREVMGGELSDPRQALFPVLAAFGGMAVPALIYAALNWNSDSAGGWAIPTATDIAFALGVLTLLGKRVPLSLKLFLSALAIVDDIGAIVVIAVFYSGSLSGLHLAYVLVIAAGTAVTAAYLKIRNRYFFLASLLLIWLSFIPTGIHATLAGIVAAMLVPAAPDATGREDCASPLEELEELLHPLVAYIILPAFILANAGVRIDGDFTLFFQDRLFLGVLAGLIIGKPLGIVLFAWLGCRLRWAQKPPDVDWKHVAGIGCVAGIGFTMSLFISGLSFPAPHPLLTTAKTAVITASFIAGALGLGLLNRAFPK